MTAGWEAYLDSLAAFGMRPGLERVSALLAAFGEPQRSFRAVHVVGTNGKSSTTRYVAALLSAHGLRTAAYLSPHLTGYAERLQIDGRPVDRDAFGRSVARVRAAVADLSHGLGETTQFEVLTVAALLAAAEAGVQAAAVEAGLGGRLDATNVLAAPVVVLTNVALDHTEVLGPTREAIFAEKAAVIAGGDAVFGPLDGLERLAKERCTATGARGHFWGLEVLAEGDVDGFSVTLHDRHGPRRYARLRLASRARYQLANAALAVTAADLLVGGLSEQRVRDVLASTATPGRLQVVRRRPLVLADGAHNPHGMAALALSLKSIARPAPRVGVFAVMRDKAVAEMLAVALPLVDRVVCTSAAQPRSLTGRELAAWVRTVAGESAPALDIVDDPRKAYRHALQVAGPSGSVLVAGSLYLLEDLAATLAGEGGEDG